MSIDFILDCMNVICVFAVFVFIEGIVAGKDAPWAEKCALILPIAMVIVTVVTTVLTLNMTYFLLLAVPTAVLWFVHRISRRSILTRKNYDDMEEEV